MQKIVKHISDMDRLARAHLSDVRIDWFRVIVDIERGGYTHSIIAAGVGVSRRTIGNWKDGSSPRFEEGEALLSLWSRVSEKGQEFAPRVSRYSYRA